MKRIVVALSVALVACEGEPPKTPAGAPAVTAPETTAEAPAPSALDGAAPSAPAAVASSAPASPCPSMSGNDGGTAVAAVVGEAGAPVVVPAPAKANLVGNVTTTPAAAAANAVVYLEDAPVEPTAKMSATVDNNKMTFAPFVAVIPVGGRIVFHNSDPFPHNVFSPDNEKFNIGNIAQNGGTYPRVFKKPGSYTLLCNLHPGMLGYVVVSPSSYYAKADAKGHFTIKDVPAGSYKVTAWAPRQQTVTQPATLEGTDVTLDFELHR